MKLKLTLRESIILCLHNQGYKFDHMDLDEEKQVVRLRANGISVRLHIRARGVISGNRPTVEVGTYKYFDRFWFRRMPPAMVNTLLQTS